jgi:hypothetical protein
MATSKIQISWYDGERVNQSLQVSPHTGALYLLFDLGWDATQPPLRPKHFSVFAPQFLASIKGLDGQVKVLASLYLEMIDRIPILQQDGLSERYDGIMGSRPFRFIHDDIES